MDRMSRRRAARMGHEKKGGRRRGRTKGQTDRGNWQEDKRDLNGEGWGNEHFRKTEQRVALSLSFFFLIIILAWICMCRIKDKFILCQQKNKKTGF